MTNAQHITAVIATGERWIKATMPDNTSAASLISHEEAERAVRGDAERLAKAAADFAEALDACVTERVRQAIADRYGVGRSLLI